MKKYTTLRRELWREIAEYCRLRTLDSHTPETAAKWAYMAATCLWCAEPDSTDDAMCDIFKDTAK